MRTNLEVSFDSEGGLLLFTQILPEEVNQKFPCWPWPDLVQAFGFFGDVIGVVNNEVKQFRDDCQGTKQVILKFRRNQVLPPDNDCFRCANAWLKFNKDLELGILTMELYHIPGTYKDFALLDVLDHLEGRAGRGKNQYVDGRPGVLRQKLERALRYGPHILHDSTVRPKRIPKKELVWAHQD